MSEFKREDRYIVIKHSDIAGFWREDVREQFFAALERLNEHQVRIPQRKFLVIESDWPEYEPAWKMIEDRVSGAPVEGGKAEYDAMAKAMTTNQTIDGRLAGWVATRTQFGRTGWGTVFTADRHDMLNRQFLIWEPVFYAAPTAQHKSTEITMAKTIHHEQSSFRTWRSDIPEDICIALNSLDMPILGLLRGTTPLARKTMALINHDRILTNNPRHPVENV